MQVTLTGTKVTIVDSKQIGFQLNNLVDTFTAIVDTTSDWSYLLDIKYPKDSCDNDQLYNIIQLNRVGNTCSVELTDDMLPFNGKYTAQFRGTSGDKVYHSDTFEIWVKYSINPAEAYDPVPSEFYQVEDRIREYNAHPPKPSADGYWYIWNVNTGAYEKSSIPIGATLPEITPSTSGKYLTNDGASASWASVPVIPEITSATSGQILTNNGSQAQWADAPEGAVTSVDGETGDVVLYDVKYTTQQLTTAQQAQARQNIGAGTSDFSGDYNDLDNKPFIPTKTSDITNDSGYITAEEAPVQSVNGQTGDVIVQEDKTYIHTQLVASSTWTVQHNMNKYPAIAVVDSSGNVVFGDIEYISTSTAIVSFNAVFSGKAYCN